jgi:hypothetical protein
MKNKKAKKPFGLEFLVEVPEAETKTVNGGILPVGRGGGFGFHFGPPPPVLHTNFISMVIGGPFPHGDHG